MYRKPIIYQTVILMGAVLFFTACAGSGTAATPTQDAQAVYTQAAEAVRAELTQSAALTPSVTPQPSVTPTLPVTPTQANTSTAPVSNITPTLAVSATNTALPGSASDDQATITAQSVSDGTKFAPGEVFKVTWTLQNSGKSTWNALYALKWYSGLSGNDLKVANTVNLPGDLKPGASIDISISFTAPKTIGAARTIWYLQNTATGLNILKLPLDIEVVSIATNTVTPTMATTSTATSTVASTPTETATAVTPSVTPTK